jgi:hypothetical protein
MVPAQAGAQSPRAVSESILPLLAYGPSCASSIELKNLADTPVDVELEAHRSSGGLAGLAARPGRALHLAPGERLSLELDIPEKDNGAWVRVRETLGSRSSPAVAVAGSAECREGNELREVRRTVAYPTRDPWFSSELEALKDAVVSILNTASAPARAAVCYSSGNLYSVPGDGESNQFRPVCSSSFDLHIPPFGARYLPVQLDGSTWMSVRVHGDAIVLQVLRPAKEGVRTYSVDSSIKFGGEVPAK